MPQAPEYAFDNDNMAQTLRFSGDSGGSMDDLLQLHKRAQENYTLNILDKFLPCFQIPSDVDWADQENSLALTRVYTGLSILIDISTACQTKPILAAPSAKKLIPALKGILFWTCAVLNLEPSLDLTLSGGITKMDVTDDPKPHNICASAILKVVDIHPSFGKQDPLPPARPGPGCDVVDRYTRRKPGALHLGMHNSSPDDPGGRDSIISLLHLITLRNPGGLARAIQSGHVCSPDVFFRRAAE
ncbi:hypothetical protein FA13DRAFT_1775865, partial [Coprinellus micaceus]